MITLGQGIPVQNVAFRSFGSPSQESSKILAIGLRRSLECDPKVLVPKPCFFFFSFDKTLECQLVAGMRSILGGFDYGAGVVSDKEKLARPVYHIESEVP